MNFTVDQEVFITHPLFHKGQGAVKAKVIKVGRKYVYVSTYREFKFDKKTLVEHGESNYVGRIYLSIQEYNDGVELSKNKIKIKKIIDNDLPKFTLEKTREILNVLNTEVHEL